MSPAPRSIGVLAAGRDDALEAAGRAIEYLTGRGLAVLLEPATADHLQRPGAPEFSAADLLIVFGGDGAVISALRAASGRGTPVVGVNYGTVGFLSEIEPDRLLENLDDLAEGRYEVRSRLMLAACVLDGEGRELAEAVAANDVVVKAGDPTHVLEFRVEADGYLIAEFPADGLIVATPVGSTAYSLSAGGPVVVPDLPALVLTPICPHTLSTRPLVLPESIRLRISVEAVGRHRQAMVSVDGRINFELVPGATLTVGRAERRMAMIGLHPSSFFDSLRGKLRWGKPK